MYIECTYVLKCLPVKTVQTSHLNRSSKTASSNAGSKII